MGFVISTRDIDTNNPQSIRRALRFSWIGFVVMIVGICLAIFWTTDRFVCERSKNLCEFQERHIWEISYASKEKIPLSDILHAIIDTRYNDNGETYQVVLKMKNNDRPLFMVYSSFYDTHANRAHSINHYLNSQDEHLEISESFWILFFPFPFILLGALFGIYIPHRLKKRLKELEEEKTTIPSQD